jgi:hypothetical protein
MDGPLSPIAVFYSLFRLAYVALGWLGLFRLWRRPRAGRAVALVVALNVLAWAAYVLPLERVYGMQERLDRAFVVGMTAATTLGHSPFDHTQVGYPNLEPLWSALPALMALARPENAALVWFWMSPLSIAGLALCLYRGLRAGHDPDDEWERALVVFCVLGLAAFSLSQRSPLLNFWVGNFLLKPNHALGFGVLAVVLGLHARGVAGWRLGLVLGLLAWVFFPHWAYACAGLAVAALLRRSGARGAASLAVAFVISAVIAAPNFLNLLREHSPLSRGATAGQVWRDVLGLHIVLPHWSTTDLGPLFVLGCAGAPLLWRRGGARDRGILAVFVVTWAVWAAGEVGILFGFCPEPDEMHYFLRFVLAVSAGAALSVAGRAIATRWQLAPGRGPLLLMALLLPLTFPASWDPPTMDRYFRYDRVPVGPKVQAYGRWIRENTAKDAVFAAGNSACTWIPAFSGRRVLLAGDARPPRDYAARKEAERILLLSRKSELIRATAARFGVDYIAIDGPMLLEYGEEALDGLGKLPVYEPVYVSSAVRILRIKKGT